MSDSPALRRVLLPRDMWTQVSEHAVIRYPYDQRTRDAMAGQVFGAVQAECDRAAAEARKRRFIEPGNEVQL